LLKEKCVYSASLKSQATTGILTEKGGEMGRCKGYSGMVIGQEQPDNCFCSKLPANAGEIIEIESPAGGRLQGLSRLVSLAVSAIRVSECTPIKVLTIMAGADTLTHCRKRRGP